MAPFTSAPIDVTLAAVKKLGQRKTTPKSNASAKGGARAPRKRGASKAVSRTKASATPRRPAKARKTTAATNRSALVRRTATAPAPNAATSVSAARLLTENHLDDFARTKANIAQGVIVELVFRLVAASVARPAERNFPLADSINQPGADGTLDTANGFAPFVPEGRSYWEIGSGLDARDKANADYSELTASTPAAIRRNATFVFVTPHSGRRGFQHTWKEKGQLTWLQKKRREKKWKNVEIIDGTKLIDWLMQFPAVERWLAGQLGVPITHTTTPDLYWQDLRLTGNPPPLSAEIFLVGREDARKRLEQLLSLSAPQLRIDTHSRQQVLDFVAAHIAALPDDQRVETAGRCLFVLDEDAWEGVIGLRERHVLVVGFDLDETDHDATSRLQNAKNRNHAVIYGAPPGGSPHPNRAALPSPRPHQLQETLQAAGHSAERSRTLAEKTGGSLASLIRLLHNASLHPEWASKVDAAELIIADFLGSWDENNVHDKQVAESLAGKTYGEWIARVRDIAKRRDAPLAYRHGEWKVVPRYEVWNTVAPHAYDDLLVRFRAAATEVLGEVDPSLELPKEERYAALVKGKVLKYSRRLRHGIAETVALLGALGGALIACTPGRAESTATLVVREVLAGRDWRAWASLEPLLPVLAEGSPDEFLSAIEAAVLADPSPVDALFLQEDSGFGGRNYTSGILWALETLAWNPILLGRVTLVLGQMAAKDPGGRWANRPMGSLAMIYLPWLPQTVATLERKTIVLKTLASEQPAQAWKLLLGLLPKGHGFSMGSRRPTWRTWIPIDRSDSVSPDEYWLQVSAYTEICVELAFSDSGRLKEMIEHLDELSAEARDAVISHLVSHGRELADASRYALWDALEDMTREHRRFKEAHWALQPEVVDRLAVVAAQLKPESKLVSYRRLFTEKDFDLIDENDDYIAQSRLLAEQRARAARELHLENGLEALLAMAKEVESPSRLGFSLGDGKASEVDAALLPSAIGSSDSKELQFVAGFVRARYYADDTWIETLSFDEWRREHIVKLLAWLPFAAPVWRTADRALQANVSEYWSATAANAYEAGPDLIEGIRLLLDYSRPVAAVNGLHIVLLRDKDVDMESAFRALWGAATAPEPGRAPGGHPFARLIQHLQKTAPERKELLKIEWAYLPFLSKHFTPGPVALEMELSVNPLFFCEVLALVFRSENDRERLQPEPTEQQRFNATRAYELLGEWHRMPGLHAGTVDEGELRKWVDTALKQCNATGHMSLGQSYIGRVCAHSPRTAPEGWPADPVARVLNEMAHDSMRRGYSMELFNMRGVHAWDAGEGERTLAQQYQEQAEALEKRGYARLAVEVRRLGDRYLDDAKREAVKDYD